MPHLQKENNYFQISFNLICYALFMINETTMPT